MKLKLIITALVLALLAFGAYFVVNTGVLSVYNAVLDEPLTAELSEVDTSAQRLNDPNQSVRPAIFRTISERNNLLVLRGTAEPDIVISILGNGERRRQIRVNSDGIWEAEIDVSKDNVLGLSLTSFLDKTFPVDGDELLIRVMPKAESQAARDANEEGNIVTESPRPLILVTAPGGPSRVVQTPFGRLPNNEALTLGAVEYDDRGGVIFSGFSNRSGRVRVFGDDELIGESRVGNNGRWFLIAGETLPLESYNLRVLLQEPDGVASSVEVNLRRLTPGENAGISPYVVYNDDVWHIRRNLYGGGVQYTAIFSPEAIVRAKAETKVETPEE